MNEPIVEVGCLFKHLGDDIIVQIPDGEATWYVNHITYKPA
jgi:hypothetical protein